ncbi:hypothetical protein B0H19DRAFT_1276614 [Mycena capillaripes]|nr:hypothetical protein B0H19DRAFT_1276614 [Mycena capillaripes]
MHDDSQTYTSRSTPRDYESPGHGGAIFAGSHHFNVTGGTFTSINNGGIPPSPPSEFRPMRLGDISLQEELGLDLGSRTVRRMRGRRPSVRRVYSAQAKVHGRKTNATVAIYQGDTAEERISQEWRKEVELYSLLRHPNFVQLYGLATTTGIYAAIFHDELIPFRHFLALYRHSPILTVYIYGYCQTEFSIADEYLISTLSRPLLFDECTLWVRRSTGQLCADLIPSNGDYWPYSLVEVSRQDGIDTSDASRQETRVVDHLTPEQYHSICYWNLSQHHRITFFEPITVTLGAIIARSSDTPLHRLVEIASVPDVEADWDDWSGAEGEVMDNDWTRFNASDVSGRTLRVYVEYEPNSGSWLSQANHIFSRHKITSEFENYAVVYEMRFEIIIPNIPQNLSPSYLFLCPTQDFQIAQSSFRWPDFPVYWSLDPSGTKHLTAEEVTEHGFPSLQLITEVDGDFWDASVYAGLRQFHQGRGFDPDSQEVARHIGIPLYRIAAEIYRPFGGKFTL